MNADHLTDTDILDAVQDTANRIHNLLRTADAANRELANLRQLAAARGIDTARRGNCDAARLDALAAVVPAAS